MLLYKLSSLYGRFISKAGVDILGAPHFIVISSSSSPLGNIWYLSFWLTIFTISSAVIDEGVTTWTLYLSDVVCAGDIVISIAADSDASQ